jgi:hypothetical protein
MATYYGYPNKLWTQLRTTDSVESAFTSVRQRITAAKRF